ncbi:MAG: hypothetical protein RLY83_858 [Actinomycetota bacterium]
MDKKKIAKTSLIAVSAVAIAGLAFTAPSLAATAKHNTVASASFQGKGHGDKGFGKGHDNRGSKPALVSQDVTVTVPDDGATYELLVTETAPPATTNSTTSNAQAEGFKNRSFVVPVTGTGSVTVSIPGLHPGTYKVDLVKVSSSQDLTVAAPATTATTATTK